MKKYKVTYYVQNAENLEASYSEVIESNESLDYVIDMQKMYLTENKFIRVDDALLNVSRISEVYIFLENK